MFRYSVWTKEDQNYIIEIANEIVNINKNELINPQFINPTECKIYYFIYLSLNAEN